MSVPLHNLISNVVNGPGMEMGYVSQRQTPTPPCRSLMQGSENAWFHLDMTVLQWEISSKFPLTNKLSQKLMFLLG